MRLDHILSPMFVFLQGNEFMASQNPNGDIVPCTAGGDPPPDCDPLQTVHPDGGEGVCNHYVCMDNVQVKPGMIKNCVGQVCEASTQRYSAGCSDGLR